MICKTAHKYPEDCSPRLTRCYLYSIADFGTISLSRQPFLLVVGEPFRALRSSCKNRIPHFPEFVKSILGERVFSSQKSLIDQIISSKTREYLSKARTARVRLHRTHREPPFPLPPSLPPPVPPLPPLHPRLPSSPQLPSPLQGSF